MREFIRRLTGASEDRASLWSGLKGLHQDALATRQDIEKLRVQLDASMVLQGRTIVEYNSLFGPDRAVTIPYDPRFQRHAAHPSNLYYGASLAALCHLADRKGYAFIGSNSNGNNAYFVRRDRLGPLKPLTAAEGWVASRFREAADDKGLPTALTWRERVSLLAEFKLEDVRSGSPHLKEIRHG